MLRKLIIAAFVAIAFFALSTASYWVKQAEYVIRPPNIVAPVEEKSVPDRLQIAHLKIDAPIVYVEEESESAFQEALKSGVAHYPGTTDVGKPGNAYIFGHSSDYLWAKGDYKAVFALLPKIKIGDEIAASDREGRVYHYKVVETKIVTRGDLSVLSQNTGGRKLLTLQTSYPVGTALKRFVVIAELVN